MESKNHTQVGKCTSALNSRCVHFSTTHIGKTRKEGSASKKENSLEEKRKLSRLLTPSLGSLSVSYEGIGLEAL